MADKNLRSNKDKSEQAEAHNNLSSMAAVAQELRTMNERISSLETLFDEKIKGLQSSLEKSFNKKVDNLRASLTKIINENNESIKQEMEQKAKQIQDNVDMDIDLLTSRIERVESTAASVN